MSDLDACSVPTKLSLDLRVHRLAAVQKTAYRMAAEVTLIFGAINGDSIEIELAFPAVAKEASKAETIRRLHRELNDQELRERIGEETRELRTLLLAHAFSRTGLLREE